MITIITHIIVVIMFTGFCNTRWNVVFDVQKKLYNIFFCEVFPNKNDLRLWYIEQMSQL